MKQKLPVILLLISTLSLGILLVVQSNQAKERTLLAESRHSKEVNQFQGQVSDLDTKLKKSAEEIAGRENEITSLGGQLSTVNQEKGRVDQELQTTAKDRDQAKAELASTKTNLVAAQKDLVQTKTNVAAVEQKLAEQIQRHAVALKVHETVAKELDAKKTELAAKTVALTEAGKKQDEDRARIAKLETSLDQVNQQVGGLKTQLVTVEKAIDDTKKKLASSEGDATYLRRELTRMEDEKAVLERQLNDLEYVRTQYKKLQEEFIVKQRIDWITRRVGIYAKDADQPGMAAILARYAEQQKTATPAATPKKPSRLSVELREDGSVNIQPIDTGTPKPVPQIPNPEPPKQSVPQTPEPPKAPAVPEAPKATVPPAPAVPAVPAPAVPAPAVPAPTPKTEPKPADVKGVVTPSPVPSTPKK